MNAKLFPPFLSVEPKTLLAALDSVSKLYLSLGSNNPRRWEQLIEKVRVMSPLSPFEKVQIALNITSVPTDIHANFISLFLANLDDDCVSSVGQYASSSIGPRELLELLSHEDVIKLSSKYLSKGIVEHISGLVSLDERSYFNSLLEDGCSIADLLKSFKVSESEAFLTVGKKRIALIILESTSLPSVLNTQFDTVFLLLDSFRICGEDALGLLDNVLKNYFTIDPAWGTKVLDEKFFLAKVLAKAPLLADGKVKSGLYKNIDLLRKKRDELDDILKLLNDSNENRGTFWEKYLTLCEYVESKEIGRTSVASVFAFSTFAIVEFAPMGAALLYDRKVFDEKIRSSRNWRDVSNCMPVPMHTEDGRLLHLPSNNGWWPKFNSIIIHLLRSGGRI